VRLAVRRRPALSLSKRLALSLSNGLALSLSKRLGGMRVGAADRLEIVMRRPLADFRLST
jgi:hypothetical protein